MNHSYNNSNYDFFGLKSDKKKKSEGDAYPYRADLNYDYAPQLSGKTSSSEKPSLFAPQSEGERIRKLLQSTVDKALGKGKYSGLFDNIDTKKIEENIPVAESVIKKNKEKNAYSMEDTKNLPYLRDGLAAFYALSESGNYKAANVASKIAYTPVTEKNAGVISKLSYDVKDQKTDPKQVDSYPAPDKENILSGLFPTYEASKELYEHIKTGFDDYDGNTFFDIITAGATALRLNPSTRLLANAPKYIVRDICKLGADFYLRKKKGYTFSADLFEHSLQENPNDLVFYDGSRVADIIRSDNNFLEKIDGLTKKIENKIPFNATDRQHKFDVGDMYYSIHGCNLEITNINYNDDGTKDISIHISDNYDYTKIWTMMDGKGISLGSIANDFGTVSTWLDAINSYKVDIYLTIRR